MKIIFVICMYFCLTNVKAQTIDTMYINLYTDSLKKGTYNYINVDGKLSNGRYLPLDSTQLLFTATHGHFSGNSLWLEPDFKEPYVDITICLRNKPHHPQKITLYIKTRPDDETLKTNEEILSEMKKNSKKKKN